jgi:hypothetical protein
MRRVPDEQADATDSVPNAIIEYRIVFTAAKVFARYMIYRGLYKLPLRIALGKSSKWAKVIMPGPG